MPFRQFQPEALGQRAGVHLWFEQTEVKILPFMVMVSLQEGPLLISLCDF